RFRLDQVQNFYPSPLANSTTMYYTGKNPLGKIGYKRVSFAPSPVSSLPMAGDALALSTGTSPVSGTD
ncbi:DUF3362 domain-containing protein, partial [Salmonella enterica subsp. enterica serovar Anatum]|nr:DUF3362 domain-containing protein [Salmonella enterica subsp. enterica serovar Anatum]